MDLFEMAGIDTSEFNSDNKTSQHKDANATSVVSSSSSSKDADADAIKATNDVIKATNDANDANNASVDSDYQTSDIQHEEATNHDLADVKRERDRIGTSMMIEKSILHDLKVQLVLLKRGNNGSDDNIKRVSDVKYRIAHIEESIDDMNKRLEQLK